MVLIDLTPEALLERLRAGKIYPPERIDAALNNFFKIENLAALREVALRQVAEEVGAKRLTTELVGSREESLAADAPQAVGERLLALVEPYPGAQRLVRRAWRSAQRLGADLDLLWVRPPGRDLSEDEERSLAALRQLASVLGAKMLEEESDDLAAAIVEVATRRGTTYILLGRSRPARGLGRLRVPLPQRLMQRLPGVDVRIVADRSGRSNARAAMTVVLVVVIAVAGVLVGIAAGYWLPPHGRLPCAQPLPWPCAGSCLPFSGEAISRRSLEAAVRLAKAENAIIMPAFLARVPMNLPLETALPVQCARGMPLLEAIEQRVASQGIAVDSRVGRGRSPAMRCANCLDQEHFDRIIVSADEDPRAGLGYDDLRWMLERVPAEILILRHRARGHAPDLRQTR